MYTMQSDLRLGAFGYAINEQEKQQRVKYITLGTPMISWAYSDVALPTVTRYCMPVKNDYVVLCQMPWKIKH